MLYLLLGSALLAGYFWLNGRRFPVLGRREWRVVSAAAALVAFTAAAWSGVRGVWGPTIVLAITGLWFAASARKTDAGGARPPPPQSRMSAEEARRILGVGEGASREEIQAAYTRLMRAVHPDKGGTAGLAAQLNAARDRLLKP
ncbi:DnaJ domain-containing protein [Phenylobacterium sp.]|uniref:J domain-containing protein n=1 Tax=Phenylobacterium sp. TaxID=1871053 RepID=UPI0025D31E85|nr:DnaJ domain-containing protein [Phenylobacterium sp.]MBX3483044.1 DnaJ domain-containing protein [Phenylobacterium sp.]